MKRKAEKQQSSAPRLAVSAVAARRVRQQQQQDNAPDTDREIEPLTKRVRSSPERDLNGTSDRGSVSAVSEELAFKLSSIEATEALGTGTSDNGEAVNDAQDDAQDMNDLDDARKLAANTENFTLSRHRLRKSDVVYSDEDMICVRLREKTTLVLIGLYDIWVKKGVISVMGAKLHPSPKTYRVYAPSTHSLPVIKCVSGVEGYAEFELRSCSTNLYRLKDLSPHFSRIWNSSATAGDNATLGGSYKRSFSILYTSSDDPLNRPLRPLHLEKKWSTTIKSFSRRAHYLKVLLCGPKGAGKSTFGRYLLNHLLTPAPQAEQEFDALDGVAFLDLDPGQPEFAPMGNIYLAHLREPCFGPPFSHPNLEGSRYGKIIRCHHIGATSPKEDPDNYALAIMNLFEQYRMLLTTYPRCPLIVNFPGWIFGLGLEVATWIIRSMGLSDVVYMSEKGPTEVVEPLSRAASEARVTLTTLPSQPVDLVTRSSAQLRSMQMQSYFHMTQPEGDQNPFWSDSPLINSEPIRVNYAGSRPDISGIMVLGSHYDPQVLRDITEGSIVAVVAIENASAIPDASEIEAKPNSATDEDEVDTLNEDVDTDPEMAQKTQHMKHVLNENIVRCPNSGLPYLLCGVGSSTPLGTKASRSLGLALVCSIDISSHTLELVSPIPSALIHETITQGQSLVLVRGTLDSPDWAFSEEYHAARNAEQDYIMSIPQAKKKHVDDDTKQQQSEHLRRLQERVQRASKLQYLNVIEEASALHSQESSRQDTGTWKLRKKVYISSDSELE